MLECELHEAQYRDRRMEMGGRGKQKGERRQGRIQRAQRLGAQTRGRERKGKEKGTNEAGQSSVTNLVMFPFGKDLIFLFT